MNREQRYEELLSQGLFDEAKQYLETSWPSDINNAFETDDDNTGRRVIVHTGVGGMAILNEAMSNFNPATAFTLTPNITMPLYNMADFPASGTVYMTHMNDQVHDEYKDSTEILSGEQAVKFLLE